MKNLFSKVTETGLAFWNTIKPFLINKGFLTSDSISLTQDHQAIYNR